ncbi:hypothetical protein [Vibrio sp. ER1A]|nr:hypothetical protein [Vibrio sp. ER1A]
MEMYQKQEPAHLDAMNKIQAMMQNPEEMKAWYEEKKREFDAL